VIYEEREAVERGAKENKNLFENYDTANVMNEIPENVKSFTSNQ